MNKEKLKKEFDRYVLEYETVDFIKNDPIQFPHRFRKKQDIEISGLISSSLAYGKRDKIIQAVEMIHSIMENEPYVFCQNYTSKEAKLFSSFKYRYTTGEDIILLFEGLSNVLKKYNSLEELFLKYHKPEHDTVKEGLIGFISELLTCDNYLLPCPTRKSACKRLNLFLKWMVRKPPVDLGVWHGVSASKLVIPLDIHVGNMARKRGILNRKSNDWQSAYEITQFLRELDLKDPTKYDFALFGEGIGL